MSPAETVYNTARSRGIPSLLANFIVAQARHETADFTSPVYRSCDNAFGYKWKGQSTAAGSCLKSPEKDFYAKYSSLEQSTQELTDWIARRQKEGKFPKDLRSITTPEKYAELLKGSDYFGDALSVYAAALRKFAVNFKAPIAFGGIAIAVITFWILYKRKKR